MFREQGPGQSTHLVSQALTFLSTAQCRGMRCFCLVTKQCLTLCNPMDCSTPGSLFITNSQSLLKLMSTKSVMPSNHLMLSRSLSSCLQSFPALGTFPMSQFFASGGPTIGASSSASVLPLNIQDCFPLGLTGWISMQSKGLSRVFPNTTV